MNKTVVTEQIIQALRDCDNAIKLQDAPFIKSSAEKLRQNLQRISGAHSGSWLGYHAYVYYNNLRMPDPGHHFSSEWGLMDAFSNHTSPNWVEYRPEAIQRAAMEGVPTDFIDNLKEISQQARRVLEDARDTLLTIAEIVLDQIRTATVERMRDDIRNIETFTHENKVIEAMRPGQIMSRDSTAVTQGLKCPPHSILSARQISLFSPFTGLEKLCKSGQSFLKFMEIHDMVEAKALLRSGKVFIGHGRSLIWRELKDFLQDRLHLSWEEFNREPAAGVATVERLQQMLDASCFAFLVMTGEDEHADQKLHARENVIHEVGLFQGKLGFRKAIVVLEEGCTEFSNITGLGQVRFPKGNISAKFEEIRQILERESII